MKQGFKSCSALNTSPSLKRFRVYCRVQGLRFRVDRVQGVGSRGTG